MSRQLNTIARSPRGAGIATRHGAWGGTRKPAWSIVDINEAVRSYITGKTGDPGRMSAGIPTSGFQLSYSTGDVVAISIALVPGWDGYNFLLQYPYPTFAYFGHSRKLEGPYLSDQPGDPPIPAELVGQDILVKPIGTGQSCIAVDATAIAYLSSFGGSPFGGITNPWDGKMLNGSSALVGFGWSAFYDGYVVGLEVYPDAASLGAVVGWKIRIAHAVFPGFPSRDWTADYDKGTDGSGLDPFGTYTLTSDSGAAHTAPPATIVVSRAIRANFSVLQSQFSSHSKRVQFLDTSITYETFSGASAWAWDFGDGKTSTIQNPVHDYAAFGTYSVSMTVTNPDGSDTCLQTLTL